MSYGIRARGLTVYGTSGQRAIIENIDFSIEAGSLIGIIGRSGAGKSTLLRSLGVRLPNRKNGDTGDLFLRHDGGLTKVVPANHDHLLHVMSFVPQEDLLVDDLTVNESLFQACVFAGVAEDAIENRKTELLKASGLAENLAEKRVQHLSGGQKRRLSIACALACEPGILLLDEPTSGLDLPVAHEVMGLLAKLCEQRNIAIVCTSHLPTTLQVCDQVVVVEPGTDKSGGSISAVFDRESYARTLASDSDGTIFYTSAAPSEGKAVAEQESIDPAEGLPALPDHEAWRFSHFSESFRTCRRSLLRDRGTLGIFLAQPVVLAVIVVLTQVLHGSGSAKFIDFFLTVSAMWIGMSFSVREFVGDRQRFALSELSGLSKNSYFAAKLAFVMSASAIGVIILTSVAHLFVSLIASLTDIETIARNFSIGHYIPRFFILAITGISGAMIGLLISALASSIRFAISWMPLALLPQVVFSKFASGYGSMPKNETGYPYEALSAVVESREGAFEFGSSVEWVNFVAGLPMTTRHSNWCLESLSSREGFVAGQFYWLDFAALLLLCFCLGLAVFTAFKLRSNHWLSLIR